MNYTLAILRLPDRPVLILRPDLMRAGLLRVDGRLHKARLIENDADGIYYKSVPDTEHEPATLPLWLQVDLDDDDEYASGAVDVRTPFLLAGKTYELKASADGASVELVRTSRPARQLTSTVAPFLYLLKPGTPAPELMDEASKGVSVRLADYKGRDVVLYFWNTSGRFGDKLLTQLTEVQKAFRAQNVAYVAVCSREDKATFSEWLRNNQRRYSIDFAYDPADTAGDTSPLLKRFKVGMLPTTYVIDKNGRIAEGFRGFQTEHDQRLTKALKALIATDK